jgi:hypothetical protein
MCRHGAEITVQTSDKSSLDSGTAAELYDL